MHLDHLVEMSNRYGADPDYVLAGGGNTSYKDEQTLYVKASGTALADITLDGFVKMDRTGLDRIFARNYPDNAQEREAEVLRDMQAACCNDAQTGVEHSEAAEPRRRRPSVEALLHHILPFAYVLHVHPAKANGMTCGKNGAEACARLFPEAVWVPQTMPGYILAKEVHARVGADTRLVFLENHGVFIGGRSVGEIDAAVAQMNAALDAVIAQRPDFSPCEYDSAKAAGFAPAVQALTAACVFHANREIAQAVSSRENFERVNPAFTPDHMVYCNDEALFIESDDFEAACAELAEKAADYQARNGKSPKIIGLKGTGFYACGRSEKEAGIAAAVFLDAAKIAVYGESFGGAKPMSDALVWEINHWEVERYRQSVSFGKG